MGAFESITIRLFEEPFFFSPDSSFLNMVHRITPWVSRGDGAQRSTGRPHPLVMHFRLILFQRRDPSVYLLVNLDLCRIAGREYLGQVLRSVS